MNTSIREYLRFEPVNTGLRSDGKPFLGEPYGIMVAELHNGSIRFGWSLTHEKDIVKNAYDKNKGLMIATRRLEAFKPNSDIVVPNDMVYAMENFILKSKRYFQTDCSTKVLNGYELSLMNRHSVKQFFIIVSRGFTENKVSFKTISISCQKKRSVNLKQIGYGRNIIPYLTNFTLSIL